METVYHIWIDVNTFTNNWKKYRIFDIKHEIIEICRWMTDDWKSTKYPVSERIKSNQLCVVQHSSTRKLYYHVNVSQIKGKRIERIKNYTQILCIARWLCEWILFFAHVKLFDRIRIYDLHIIQIQTIHTHRIQIEHLTVYELSAVSLKLKTNTNRIVYTRANRTTFSIFYLVHACLCGPIWHMRSCTLEKPSSWVIPYTNNHSLEDDACHCIRLLFA